MAETGGRRQLRIGCCGFPRARALYYRTFSVVELQQTFYRPPRPQTALRWREQAPDGFEFTLKAWQLITHEPASPTYRRAGVCIPPQKRGHYGSFRGTDEVWEAWLATQAIAEAVAARVIVFQCPASFTPSAEHVANLRSFAERLPRGRFVYVWEPRGDWPSRLVEELCRELDLVHCVDPFMATPLAGSIAYFRLHGMGGYRYRYSDEELARLASALPQDRPCYCLFNNTSMYEDALRFAASLGQLPARETSR